MDCRLLDESKCIPNNVAQLLPTIVLLVMMLTVIVAARNLISFRPTYYIYRYSRT